MGLLGQSRNPVILSTFTLALGTELKVELFLLTVLSFGSFRDPISPQFGGASSGEFSTCPGLELARMILLFSR